MGSLAHTTSIVIRRRNDGETRSVDFVEIGEKFLLNNSMPVRFPHPLWEAECRIEKFPFATSHLSPCPVLVAGVRNNSWLTDAAGFVPGRFLLRSNRPGPKLEAP
jgi:hypothetical protein